MIALGITGLVNIALSFGLMVTSELKNYLQKD